MNLNSRKEARPGRDGSFLPEKQRAGAEQFFMKRRCRYALTAALILLMAVMSACGKSYFGVAENTGKRMLISATNAGKDSYFMSGSLTVEEGEKITASADLSKGQIRVEIYLETGEQSMDQMPRLEEDPVLAGDLKGGESLSGSVPAGTCMVKAACLEKASGTVTIEVQPAE